MTKQDSTIECTMVEQDFLFAIDFIGQQYELIQTINKQPISDYSKEQWETLRQGLRQSAEAPRKSRGSRM